MRRRDMAWRSVLAVIVLAVVLVAGDAGVAAGHQKPKLREPATSTQLRPVGRYKVGSSHSTTGPRTRAQQHHSAGGTTTTTAAAAMTTTAQTVRGKPSIVFIKLFKCASSTTSGVLRRMALRVGLSGVHDQKWILSEPGIWANHNSRPSLQANITRLRGPYMMISMVRDPVARCLSKFYRGVVLRAGGKPTAEAKVRALAECQNFMLKYLGSRMYNKGEETPAEVLADYLFIGASERAEESFLLMLHLLKPYFPELEVWDILHLNAKVSSVESHGKQSEHIPLEYEDRLVQQFAKPGGTFSRENALDYELNRLVHRRMDSLISTIPDFDEQLKTYRKYLAKVAKKCKVAPPCLWGDNGCAQDCINQLARKLGDRRPQAKFSQHSKFKKWVP